jgi:uncharacterized protein (TIGR03435 family)
MNSTDRDVKDLIDRHLKWPSDLAYMAARDRVRAELLSTPAHLQKPRVDDVRGVRLQADLRLAAAAAVLLAAIATAMLWPRGPQLYTAGAAGMQVTLDDGSQIEMRANAEMTVEREDDGLGIRLHGGDIIVTAAKQRDGHLYVLTKDMTIAVVGTVFLVNAGIDGSRVAVIEGEVRVREGDVETRLRPGEQVATSPTIARRPVAEDIDWTRQPNIRQSIHELFMKGIAQTAGALQPLNPGQAAAGSQIPDPGSRILEFEEASIRECDPDNLPPPPQGARGGGANSFQMTPGRLFALCVTPATLIRTAYNYTPAALDTNPARGGRPARGMNVNIVYGLGIEDGLRVRGGPDWVRNTHYTIEAVAATPADAETLRGPMLRALFERRFGLKMHIETEQIPAFALTVAPGGLKIKEGTCVPPAVPPTPGVRGSTADAVRRNLDAARRGETTTGSCGGMSGAVHGPNMVFVGAGAPLPGLGGFLAAPVVDRTGVLPTARFNYVLEFSPDETTPGPLGRVSTLPSMQIAADPSSVPPAPPLRTVLEEQFGLRLEPAQAPREYIVIDAIQRPAPN